MKRIVLGVALVVFVATALMAFGYEYYYPKYVCNGQVRKEILWSGGGKSDEVLLDKKEALSMSMIVRRGAIYLNEIRFPFYKELTNKSNFAAVTEVGYKGSYEEAGLLEGSSEFEFTFNRYTKVLSTRNKSTQMHFYKGVIGNDRATLEYLGECKRVLP